MRPFSCQPDGRQAALPFARQPSRLQRVVGRTMKEKTFQSFTTLGSIFAPPVIHDKGITDLKSAEFLPSVR